ncbi:polysaccharide deacetylase family protein [Shewanella psychropiezotolerans]|uniref:Polysaccharide deacetylase family protein n=1 Tax=Shewanella psychropiezotolerans TaxID=2593655 RepID=A0ABX5WTZ3_9GAMM|nr:polysaccharide deacetylase family protein [Shewanella psychropiezotolerans]QDO82276.1 polysaccharide deacetylase family protein [Shewanella psychropiezotolerans]
MMLIESKQRSQAIENSERPILSESVLLLIWVLASLLLSACGGSSGSTAKVPVDTTSISSGSTDNSGNNDSGNGKTPRASVTLAGVDYQPILDELALPTYWAIDSEPSEEMLSGLNAQLARLSNAFSSQFTLDTFVLGIKLDPLQTQAFIIDISSSELGQSRVILTLAVVPEDSVLTQPLARAIYLALRQAHQVEDGLLGKLVSNGLALHFIESKLKPAHLYQETELIGVALNDAITQAKSAIDNEIDNGTGVDVWFDGTEPKDDGIAWKLGYYLVEQHFSRYPGSDASNAFSLDPGLFRINLASSITVNHKDEQYVRTGDVANQVEISELTRQASDYIGAYFLEGWNRDKLIALTFDDGPSIYTTQILDLLAQYKIPASFFWMGQNMKSNQAIMSRALAEGHTLANHSWSHPHGRSLTNNDLWQTQILKTNELFETMLGISPRFYRPPYGEITDEQVAFLDEKGMKVILWSVDTRDWNSPIVTVENISDVMINNLHPEVINLMHDAGGNRTNTVDALPAVIDYYRSQGYRFVNLETMLGISDKS